MQMSVALEGFRSDLLVVAGLGDEGVAAAAERIGAVVVPAARSRILDLLSELAAELTTELPEGRVELRLIGDDASFAYIGDPEPSAGADDELSARITLRLSESLKGRVESSAAGEGQSVNAWILRTLERRAGWPGGHKTRNRLHGYATS